MVNPILPSSDSSIELDFEQINYNDTFDSTTNETTDTNKTISYEINENEREEMEKEYYKDLENQLDIPKTDIENVDLVLQDLEKGFKNFKMKSKKFFINCCEYLNLCVKEYLKKF